VHGPTAEVTAEKAIMAEATDTTKATTNIAVTTTEPPAITGITGPIFHDTIITLAITGPIFHDIIITITTTITIPNDTAIGIIGRILLTGMGTTVTECIFPLATLISILDSASAASGRPMTFYFLERGNVPNTPPNPMVIKASPQAIWV
jgi:hypothetical protein